MYADVGGASMMRREIETYLFSARFPRFELEGVGCSNSWKRKLWPFKICQGEEIFL